MKRLPVPFLALLALLAGSLSVSAGGSWLYPDQDRYEPGETATLVGNFGGGTVGPTGDGPFFAYLRVDPAAAGAESDTEDQTGRLWSIHSSDLLLGELVVERAETWGNVGTAVFTVPDVQPGLYSVVYCNDPCTDGIGDLIGGMISISQDPDYPLTLESQAAAQEAELNEAPTVERREYSTTTVVEPPSVTEPVEVSAAFTVNGAAENDLVAERLLVLGIALFAGSALLLGRRFRRRSRATA